MTDKTRKVAGIPIRFDPTMPRDEIRLKTSTGDSVTVTNLGESPSSVVEALPTEDTTAELTRKNIWGWWKQSKQDFGYAHMQSFVRDAIQKAIDAEKAELSRQLEEARLRITNLETGRSRKRNQIKVLRGKLASLKHRNWLDGIPRVTHSDAKWKLLNTGLKLRAEAAEAKLAEATRELEQLKLERGREVHPAD